jgi:hypothetical protein
MNKNCLPGALASAFLGLSVMAFCMVPSHQSCAVETALSYAEDIVPIMTGRCVSCHRPGGSAIEASGLDLSTYQGLMKGTKFGPVIVPGNPEMSNLMWLLDWRASPQLRMAHGKKKLSSCDRDAIRAWIRQGAKDN